MHSYFARNRFGIIAILLSLFLSSQAQKAITFFVRDAATGELIPGAHVWDTLSGKGGVTNANGIVTLWSGNDSVVVNASCIGYMHYQDKYKIPKDTVVTVRLLPGLALAETTVVGVAARRTVTSDRAGMFNLTAKDLQHVPMMLGEPDLMKVLQSLPGVSQGREGSSEIYVRGGSGDQNLLLLDGAPVYNLNHAFGMLSLFNTEAISMVDLYKGGIPARYGGRLSSVVDVAVREGNDRQAQGSFFLGSLSAGLTFERPLIKEKCSFLVSARRSWPDLLVSGGALALKTDITPSLSFHDVNVKLNYKLPRNQQLFGSFYMGGDRLALNLKNDGHKSRYWFGWGNYLGSIRWTQLITPSVFGKMQLYYSSYYDKEEFDSNSNNTNMAFDRLSLFNESGFRYSVETHLRQAHSLSFGIEQVGRWFKPGEISQEQSSEKIHYKSETDAVYLSALFTDYRWENSRWMVNLGLRWQWQGNGVWHDLSAEPRLAANYKVNRSLTIKTSGMVMSQSLHAINRSSTGWPGFIYVPSTATLDPQKSIQVSAGMLFKPAGKFILDGDFWVKRTDNLLASYNSPPTSFATSEWKSLVQQGEGKSAGFDLLGECKFNKVEVRLAYTIAKAMSRFDVYHEGHWFAFDYDRRHDLSINGIWEVFKDKYINRGISSTFVYRSGAPFMMPTAEASTFPLPLDGTVYDFYSMEVYSGPNNVRMPDYHRLDVMYQSTLNKKRGQRTWSIGIYNVYNRQNPYLYYRDNEEYKVLSVFVMMPYLSFKRTF